MLYQMIGAVARVKVGFPVVGVGEGCGEVLHGPQTHTKWAREKAGPESGKGEAAAPLLPTAAAVVAFGSRKAVPRPAGPQGSTCKGAGRAERLKAPCAGPASIVARRSRCC